MTGEQKPGGLSEAWRVLRKTFSDRFEDGNDHEIERMEAAVVAAEPAEARIRDAERAANDALDEKAAMATEYVKTVERLTDRATAAEAKLARAVEAVRSIIKWGDSRCPCYNDLPDPCPLCDASVANLEGCKAAEKTFPPRLLADMRQTLAALQQGTQHQ